MPILPRHVHFVTYQDSFTRQHRLVHRMYQHQRLGALGAVMGGKLDSYRVFAERMVRLLGPTRRDRHGGALGVSRQ